MVEANPDIEPTIERLAEVEEEIFEVIDLEILATHEWCKDLVRELTERYESLARRHLVIVQNKLVLIEQTKIDFNRLGRLQAQEQLKQRLLGILQSEANREPILIGAEADYCNSNGEVLVNKVQKGLAQSEKAVLNRCQKLQLRLSSADLTNEIQRKIQHTCSEIDQIISQYAEGSQQETHTETFRRRLEEWDQKWKKLQAHVRQVGISQVGPNSVKQSESKTENDLKEDFY